MERRKMQTLCVDASTYVVSLAGSLDIADAVPLGAMLARLHGSRVIVDLFAARSVHPDVVQTIIVFAEDSDVTVVARPTFLHVLELLEADVILESSLTTAVARAV
jgi:hypothetical protein